VAAHRVDFSDFPRVFRGLVDAAAHDAWRLDVELD